MAAVILVCFLVLLFPVEGDVVEHVGATRSKVICTVGEFPYTENTGLALQDVVAPSRIINQFRGVNSSEECRNLCCDFDGCNVASFISLDDITVCALVTCVDNLSCLWQSYTLGVASFIERQINEPQPGVPTVNETSTQSTTTTTVPTATTTPEVVTTTSNTNGGGMDDSWWLNPFNWGRQDPDEIPPPPVEENSNLNTPIDGVLDINNSNMNPNGQNATKSTSTNEWGYQTDNGIINNKNVDGGGIIDNNKNLDGGVNNNLNAPEVNFEPPAVFGKNDQSVGGSNDDVMGTSWQGDEPLEMPGEDNTTYTVGLAVFLASLGLAGVLVLTIHFISKKRQKSRYHLLEVEEDLHGDKQPFLPK